jgi:hypothetical protein
MDDEKTMTMTTTCNANDDDDGLAGVSHGWPMRDESRTMTNPTTPGSAKRHGTQGKRKLGTPGQHHGLTSLGFSSSSTVTGRTPGGTGQTAVHHTQVKSETRPRSSSFTKTDETVEQCPLPAGTETGCSRSARSSSQMTITGVVF